MSVLKCLQAALPQEDFIYVGDTARTPYGPRSEAEVRRFVGEIIDYLDGRGVKLVVIACNTLTVLGVDTLKGSHAFEIVGMSKGAQLVLAASSRKKIGVFATEFTINSCLLYTSRSPRKLLPAVVPVRASIKASALMTTISCSAE